MVELKNGETYSGVLASCDGFMNLFPGMDGVVELTFEIAGLGQGFACR